MGKIQEFEIAFDQNKVVYGPGESISGTVRVRLGQALTCKGRAGSTVGSQGTTSSAVTQQFTYMLVKTGTVVLKAETDMKGYTPGQVIQVTANIHNQSGKSTGHMAASLMQRVTYETKRPTHDARAMVEVEGGVVKAGKEVEWKEQIIIPPLPQSSLAGCELIKIEYYVKNQPPSGPSAAPGGFGGPPGATAPYPPESAPGSVPTTLILPPDYGTSAYPQVYVICDVTFEGST
ncbi:hypothetical protein F2P81_013758 [Scophthalmus maximus]|uniref:Arrestin C-terminal-like domain-containing protein n=1 Tax=Scophthalmus maximus TaxID=52904 RepID=A0A6A4SUB7_SCOMX|nr:hypothetical protein F2P81_013758 [Scophthalmus maximus]